MLNLESCSSWGEFSQQPKLLPFLFCASGISQTSWLSLATTRKRVSLSLFPSGCVPSPANFSNMTRAHTRWGRASQSFYQCSFLRHFFLFCHLAYPFLLPLFLCRSPLALLTNCLFMFFKSQIQDTSMGQDCDTLLKLQYHRTDSWQCFGPNIIVKDAAIKTKKSLLIFKEQAFNVERADIVLVAEEQLPVASIFHCHWYLVLLSLWTKKHQQFLMTLSSISNLQPLLSLNQRPSKARRTSTRIIIILSLVSTT